MNSFCTTKIRLFSLISKYLGNYTTIQLGYTSTQLAY